MKKDRRHELLDDVEEFKGMEGFTDSLILFERTLSDDIGDQIIFSRKDYDLGEVKFHLGKINDYFYIGRSLLEGEMQKEEVGGAFKFFDDKNVMKLYLNKEFEGLNQSDKAFWMNEIESFDE